MALPTFEANVAYFEVKRLHLLMMLSFGNSRKTSFAISIHHLPELQLVSFLIM